MKLLIMKCVFWFSLQLLSEMCFDFLYNFCPKRVLIFSTTFVRNVCFDFLYNFCPKRVFWFSLQLLSEMCVLICSTTFVRNVFFDFLYNFCSKCVFWFSLQLLSEMCVLIFSTNFVRNVCFDFLYNFCPTCVFWFALQLLSEICVIIRRIERDMIQNVYWTSRDVPLLSDLSGNWNFSTNFRKILKNQISRKILPAVVEFLHAERQTDRHSEFNRRFSSFYERVKNTCCPCLQ